MNIEFFRQVPFFRLLIPFVAGIVLRLYLPFQENILLVLLITTLCICFCFTVIVKLAQNYLNRWIFGASATLGVLILGIFLTGRQLMIPGKNLSADGVSRTYTGLITNPAEEHPKTISAFLNIRVDDEKTEKILLYFQKDSVSQRLNAGDLVIFRTTIDEIEKNGNPHEFDYKQYLWYKGIKYSGFVNSCSWKCLSHNNLPFIRMLAFRMREKLVSTFSEMGLSGNELGVASALTIGDKTNLDDEIKQAYVASGTMHILAVSGMHVALLYWVLNLALSFLKYIRYGRFAWLILILTCIWFYALLTGMAPSISRASVMISFIAVGKVFDRPVNIFNPIAASALFLLIINPLNLFDIGFQLSYAAVISIVIFQPYIQKWFRIKNWLVFQIWNIISVTLAAQVLTTPLSLFYFHQFPNLFLISNIIMIPLSTLIMYSSLIMVPLSHWIPDFFWKFYESLIWLLNKTVIIIEGLPFALTRNIYLNVLQTLLIFIVITLISLFLIRRKPVFLIASLCGIFFFLAENLTEKYINLSKKEIVFYHDNKNSIIRFQNGNSSVWIVNQKTEKLFRYIGTAQFACGSSQNEIVVMKDFEKTRTEKRFSNELWMHGRFIRYFSKALYISNGDNSDTLLRTTAIDYIYLRPGKTRLRPVAFKTTIIIDPSVQKSTIKRVSKSLAARNDLYNMDRSGALIVKVKN